MIRKKNIVVGAEHAGKTIATELLRCRNYDIVGFLDDVKPAGSHVAARKAGAKAKVFLFGSRLNDEARDGDIDLLFETDERLPLLTRAEIKVELESHFSFPVDVLARARKTSPTLFQEMILSEAVRSEYPT